MRDPLKDSPESLLQTLFKRFCLREGVEGKVPGNQKKQAEQAKQMVFKEKHSKKTRITSKTKVFE